jgi:hypothetical protein
MVIDALLGLAQGVNAIEREHTAWDAGGADAAAEGYFHARVATLSRQARTLPASRQRNREKRRSIGDPCRRRERLRHPCVVYQNAAPFPALPGVCD